MLYVYVVIELWTFFLYRTDLSQDKNVSKGGTTVLIFLKVTAMWVAANYNDRVPR